MHQQIPNQFASIYRRLDDNSCMSELRKHSVAQIKRIHALRRLIRGQIDENALPALHKSFLRLVGRPQEAKNFWSESLEFKTQSHRKTLTLGASGSRTANTFLNQIESLPLKVVIHGSHADDTTTSYSDFDCSCFIERDQLSTEKLQRTLEATRALERIIRLQDPNSHHGAFYFLQDELNCYPEPLMPLSAWEGGVGNFSHLVATCRQAPDLSFQTLIDAVNATLEFLMLQDRSETYCKTVISTYFIAIVKWVQFTTDQFESKQSIFSDPTMFCNNHNQTRLFKNLSLARKTWISGKQNYYIGNQTKVEIANHLLDLLNLVTEQKIIDKIDGYLL